MRKNVYESALTSLLTALRAEACAGELLTAADAIALSMAGEVDRLAARIESDSREMAERFARFADAMTDGVSLASKFASRSPMGYSTLRDLEVNVAQLEAKRDGLCCLLRAVYGEKLCSAMLATIREGGAK